METILVTGTAGFIGSKVSECLINKGYQVVGLDNLNHYYDVRLKEKRLEDLLELANFKFYQIDIEDFTSLESLFQKYQFHGIINEAARAGIRASIENPLAYQKTNVEGNLNLLELGKKYKVGQYVLASTSSVYSGCSQPFQEECKNDTPLSPYAATKMAAELMTYTYHYLYQMNVTVLRYFTVYGPAARPDMSIFRFIKWIMEGNKVQIFGDGKQVRDFTYIDDIAEGTIRALGLKGFHRINLGNNNPSSLSELIYIIEKYTGRKAKMEFLPILPEDMRSTWADISKAKELLDWQPKVTLDEGIKRTVSWMKGNWEWVRGIKV
ncbi:MAG TPA: GDP-mannose 4,6-dehydratase [Atribacterota bacterium]|nr:GDP-mannose 4,6-dehydratase [Atribacterota bacterium]